VAESGVPGFDTYQWYGLLVPSRTPRKIIARLNRATAEVIQDANVEALLASQALAPTTDTPEEFEDFFRGQIAKWTKILKPAGVPMP
jgi:tripartite-type tricarboxylate transporter receptor subunit TctC